MQPNDPVTLTRDVEAALVPAGTAVTGSDAEIDRDFDANVEGLEGNTDDSELVERLPTDG